MPSENYASVCASASTSLMVVVSTPFAVDYFGSSTIRKLAASFMIANAVGMSSVAALISGTFSVSLRQPWFFG